ncbi:MAG: glycosyltransferase family 4 protein, partial [Armatimonadetes bacterium]|nr:glycosyltransferase family 4 protein [Armatimonadota bacterium]
MPPERKTEILYLNHVSRMSGAEASLLSLLTHLDTGVYRPVIGVPAPGPLVEQLRAMDIEVVFLEHPRLRRSGNPLRLVRQYVDLRRGAEKIAAHVGEERVDIIHANSLSSALAAGRAAGDGAALIWHVRDLRLPRPVTRRLIRQADAIVAISKAVAARLVEMDRRAADKTRVVYNGVDTEAFAPRPSRAKLLAELGLPDNALLVGGVGQLVPWKNWPRFLSVGADVAARAANTRLLIIGGDLFHDYPHYTAELKAYAEDLAIGRITHFLGHRSDIADVVSALDVFVHCTDDEPLGRAIMEAMSLQRPVVAVRSGGPAELIVDGESGLLAPPRNTYAIADRVVQVLKDRELAGRLGQAARLRVESHFRPEQTARLVEQIYQDVLWQRRGAPAPPDPRPLFRGP